MKIVGVIFLWLTTMTTSAQTSQPWPVCRGHLRAFGAHWVDLTPLFEWWRNQPVPTNAVMYTAASINVDTNAVDDEDRPLRAWHRVTGTPVATTGSAWIVDATIYTSPTARTNTRIILYNPPIVEQQTYNNLKNQLTQLDQQIGAARHTYQDNTNSEQQAMAYYTYYNRSWGKADRTAAVIYLQRAQIYHKNAVAAFDQLNQLYVTRQPISSHLKSMPSMYDEYYIDWFAVMLGFTKQGMPMYDMGLVSPNPP